MEQRDAAARAEWERQQAARTPEQVAADALALQTRMREFEERVAQLEQRRAIIEAFAERQTLAEGVTSEGLAQTLRECLLGRPATEEAMTVVLAEAMEDARWRDGYGSCDFE